MKRKWKGGLCRSSRRTASIAGALSKTWKGDEETERSNYRRTAQLPAFGAARGHCPVSVQLHPAREDGGRRSQGAVSEAASNHEFIAPLGRDSRELPLPHPPLKAGGLTCSQQLLLLPLVSSSPPVKLLYKDSRVYKDSLSFQRKAPQHLGSFSKSNGLHHAPARVLHRIFPFSSPPSCHGLSLRDSALGVSP